MIKGLSMSAIWSEDLNNLLPFYRDTLGLSVGHEAPGFTVLGDPNTPTIALGTHSEVHGRASDPNRHIIGLATDDIDAEYTRLKSKGVEFLEEPSAAGAAPVRFASFKDPEGNLLQLVQYMRAL
jgi:catechol 2,3-dioxygenase-like lactoylglutathione lyase family enzyme